MKEEGWGGNRTELGRTKGTERSQACQDWAQFALLSPALLPKVPRVTWPQQAPALACVKEEAGLLSWCLRPCKGTQDPLSSYPRTNSRSGPGPRGGSLCRASRRTGEPQLHGDLPVRHSWHRLACPGVEAKSSYPVETEEEKAEHEPRTPVFTGQNTGQMEAGSQVSALEII